MYILFRDLAAKGPDSVYGGGIALQGHADLQPVPEDRGDQRAFRRHHGLLLDHGGDGDDCSQREARSRLSGKGLGIDPVELPDHHPDKSRLIRPGGDSIGGWVEVAFDAFAADAQFPEQFAVEALFEKCLSF